MVSSRRLIITADRWLIVASAIGCVLLLAANAFLLPNYSHRYRHHNGRALMTKQSNDEAGSKDNDFQNWAKGLVNWGTAGSESNNQNDTSLSFDSFPFSLGPRRSPKIWDSEMSPLVASMSGMVNVEALIAAANETDDDVMTLMPDLKLLSKQANVDEREDSTKTLSSENKETNNAAAGSNVFPFLENTLRWDELLQIPLLQRNVQELNDILSDDVDMNVTFDDLVNLVPQEGNTFNDTSTKEDATLRLDLIINSVSSTFSPSTIQNLILRASKSIALQELVKISTSESQSFRSAPRVNGSSPNASSKSVMGKPSTSVK